MRRARIRSLSLVALLGALLAPLAALASGSPCCADMASPCHQDPAPCTTIDAAPCCDVAPPAAWPTAERESGASLQAAPTRASLALAEPSAPEAPSVPGAAQPDSPARLSVVLRN